MAALISVFLIKFYNLLTGMTLLSESSYLLRVYDCSPASFVIRRAASERPSNQIGDC